jgi:hypothetical protein
MARDMASYLMRVLLIVGLCWLVGATRCTSGDIRKEVIEQQVENQGAKATAARYIPEGPDRERVFSALDNSSDLMAKQAQKLAKETERADENESAARLLFWLKIGAVVLVAGGLWLKLKR